MRVNFDSFPKDYGLSAVHPQGAGDVYYNITYKSKIIGASVSRQSACVFAHLHVRFREDADEIYKELIRSRDQILESIDVHHEVVGDLLNALQDRWPDFIIDPDAFYEINVKD